MCGNSATTLNKEVITGYSKENAVFQRRDVFCVCSSIVETSGLAKKYRVTVLFFAHWVEIMVMVVRTSAAGKP